MTFRLSIVAVASCVAAGLVATAMPAGSLAGPLSIGPKPALPLSSGLSQPVAEKSQSKSSTTRQAAPKKAEPAKKAAPVKKQSSGGQSGGSSSGGGSSGSGQSGTQKTTAPKARTTQPSGTTDLSTIGTPSKTKAPPPDAKTKAPVTQERVTDKTKSLDEALGLKPLPKTKDEAAGDLGTLPELDPEASEGGTYTTQDVTQEELDQIAEENDSVNDVDGDGDYEITEPLSEEAEVTVEDGVAYIDNDGDGEVDYVVPEDHYDPDSNTLYLPVSTDSISLNDAGNPVWDDDAGQGYVWHDSDGDGVDELYTAQDTDGDGVADVVVLEYEEGGGYSREELEAMLEDEDANVYDIPGTTAEAESDYGTGNRPRVNVTVTIAPSTAGTAATSSAAAGNEIVANLQQLKLLFDQRVLSAVEYDNAQVRALADINPSTSSVEGGLTFLRELWQRRLITEAPYSRKRRELLDAL